MKNKLSLVPAEDVLRELRDGDLSCPWCGRYTNITFYGGYMQCWHCRTTADQVKLISKLEGVSEREAGKVFSRMMERKHGGS